MRSLIAPTYFNRSWPYDQALFWMKRSHTLVLKGHSNGLIACGSHRESIITVGRHCDLADHEKKFDRFLLRKLDRGGGMTLHEPGQLVLYPVIHMQRCQLSVRSLVSLLEETMMNFLDELDIVAKPSSMSHGVFIGQHKVGFIGLRIKEGVSTHGLAINVLNDAASFSLFDPCGIKSLSVTSAKYHAHLEKPLEVYQKMLVEHFLRLFYQYSGGELHG